MNQSAEKIFKEASMLSPVDRAELLERIIESFDIEPDQGIKKAWAEEAEKRLSDYKNGKAALISEKDVFYRIEKDRKE